ncbi:MAG: hypothetical protein O3A63_01130 [Proteobacteria bacterium]|nr:hypothetical protein [Pseudomonadota bacterium]
MRNIGWTKARLYVAGLLLCSVFAQTGHAVGTTAGREIRNTAQVAFDIGGVSYPSMSSNTVATFVDELIDVSVVSDNGGIVPVATPAASALLQFTVTNNGNGTETFRIITEDAISEGGFDPTTLSLYLETNAIPGLQTGAGGDTVYTAGANDPTLGPDATQIVYVDNSIPGGLPTGNEGQIEIRAIATTVIAQTGTDDPASGSFPVPGDSYAGAGDLGENGGGNVNAVVGTSHDTGNLILRTSGTFRVTEATVTMNKSVTSVVDPFGGSTVVPGSVLTYQLDVTVNGAGSVDNFVVSDLIPADLAFASGTLMIDGVAEDDDFIPLATDNAGFNAGTSTVTVDLGTVGGGSVVSIVFEAALR